AHVATLRRGGPPRRRPGQAPPAEDEAAEPGQIQVATEPRWTMTDPVGSTIYAIRSLAWFTNPAGQPLLVSCGSHVEHARIWDPSTGQNLTTLAGHSSTVHGVAAGDLGNDQWVLASGSWDDSARVWGAAAFDCLTTVTTSTEDVNGVALTTT